MPELESCFPSAPHRLLGAYRLALFVFAVWFAVGLGFLAAEAGPLLAYWEDFLFIAFGAAVVFLEGSLRFGLARLLAIFGWIAAVSAVIETVGALSGFPFGDYAYTERFGPRLFGVLPLAIPLAWCLIVWPLFLLAGHLVRGKGIASGLARAGLVGLLAMGVDIGLEPVAAWHRQYWVWQGGGIWYGVPAVNFAGWFGSALLIALGLEAAALGRHRGWLREPPADALVVPHLLLACVLTSFFLVALLHVGAPAALALAAVWLMPALVLGISFWRNPRGCLAALWRAGVPAGCSAGKQPLPALSRRQQG